MLKTGSRPPAGKALAALLRSALLPHALRAGPSASFSRFRASHEFPPPPLPPLRRASARSSFPPASRRRRLPQRRGRSVTGPFSAFSPRTCGGSARPVRPPWCPGPLGPAASLTHPAARFLNSDAAPRAPGPAGGAARLQPPQCPAARAGIGWTPSGRQ
ncbi:unnamed protein product [Rangifer tarandus platyrhynchus]|uniref:Uncharacterized protein n=2 Tax=Rangifer tarandus platyrhynchus TaxID=3082113 RepID=A0ACB0EI41_RANTA|nr:unnamed protein product [Rangifer tarandus platyrhynchus]CAI9700310.1 unnamed protein product [Rangifer tarandus platyrhynchus]